MKKETQKGLALLVIILGVAVLVTVSFFAGRFIQPGSKQASSISDSIPAITPLVTPAPEVSANVSITETTPPAKITKNTPTPTAKAVSPYQIEARLVCARADEGFAFDNHVDLVYQVSSTDGQPIPFATLTLTDNKTKDVIDFANSGPPGNSTFSSWNGTLHWKLRDRDNKEIIYTADGREYTLKLYKLTTVSEAVTQDMQPVTQKTFSKVCEF